jgi:hypothetical protein
VISDLAFNFSERKACEYRVRHDRESRDKERWDDRMGRNRIKGRSTETLSLIESGIKGLVRGVVAITRFFILSFADIFASGNLFISLRKMPWILSLLNTICTCIEIAKQSKLTESTELMLEQSSSTSSLVLVPSRSRLALAAS